MKSLSKAEKNEKKYVSGKRMPLKEENTSEILQIGNRFTG